MRAHLWIVGLGLVVFACQSALAAMFSITSGSCTLSGDCIRTPNYPGQYSSENSNYYGRRLLQSYSEGNSCIFATLAAGTVSTTAFNTYSSGDYLRIGATYYRGAGSVNGPDSNGHDRYPSYSGNSGTTGPSGVSVSSGQQISWTVDNYGVSTGWELCLTAAAPTPSPTTAGPARMSTTGTCILSGTNGDCVSSPNYPNPYDSTDCTITNNQAGYLNAATFNTESNYDTLNIRRRGIGAYSGRLTAATQSSGHTNIYLGAGEQITWTSDTSVFSTGWQICNTAAVSDTTAATTAGTTTASVETVSQAVTISGLASSDYTGTLQRNYEKGYGIAVGACASSCSTYNDGISISSSATSRRAATVTFVMTLSGASDTSAYTGGCSGTCTSSTLASAISATTSTTVTVSTIATATVTTSAPTSAPYVEVFGSCGCTGQCDEYRGSCGALATETDCWSYSGRTYACYADSADRCCEDNGGAVAGILIAILVFCVIIPVSCCCFFCGSCPLAKSRNQKTVVHVQQIQPPPVSQPTAPIMHQPVQPPPQAIPMAAQPIAMVAQPVMKQEAPPMAPPPPGQSGVQYGAAPAPPPYQPQGASVAPSAPVAFCASCGTANDSGGAFCASCGAQF